MGSWKGINEGSWSFKGDKIYGYGGGIGAYKTSYALNKEGDAFFNGKVSADIKIAGASLTGAGLICRADDMWTFVALYAYSATRKEEKSTLMRIAVFKQGAFLPVSTLKEKIDLDANFNHFSLDFFSGRVIGEISTSKRTYRLEALVPHVPFPGYAGLVKFYGAGIIVKNVDIEKIHYSIIPLHDNSGAEMSPKTFKYDVFISHASEDKPIIENIIQDFKNKGISYWYDGDQITYGDSITNKLEEGLRESRNVLVCISSNFGRSNWIKAEYGPILNRELSRPSGKKVIPLKIDDCSDDEIPLLLYNLRRAEYSNKKQYNDLLNFIKN